MSDGSLLPCLWTKTKPDSTWKVMFLISFSENILFSLAAKRRDREEKEKKGRGGKQNWTKRNPEKCICCGFRASVGRACEVKTAWLTSLWEEQVPKFAESTHPWKKGMQRRKTKHLVHKLQDFDTFIAESLCIQSCPFSNVYGSATPQILQSSNICLRLQRHVGKTFHLPCLWINDRPCKIWKLMFRLTDSGKSFFLEA